MPRINLTSIDDPRIGVFRDLRSSHVERRAGLFIAEGMLLVRRLITSSFAVHSVLVDEKRYDEIQVPIAEHVPVYCLPNGLVEKVVGFNFHRGAVAAGYRRPLPPLVSQGSLHEPRWLVVACAEIHDPENMGGIVRSCSALGVSAVVLGPQCADPFSRRALRVSMGASLAVPIYESLELFADLAAVRSQLGAVIAATVLAPDAVPLARASRPDRLVLVFGSEGHGLPHPWHTFSDTLVTLPMHERADSLNVAVACGIFLYHFTRGEYGAN